MQKSTNSISTRLSETTTPAISFITSHLSSLSKPTSVQASTSIHTSYNPTMSDRTTGVSKYGLSHSSISMHTKSTNSIITRLRETTTPAISFITSHLSSLSNPTSVPASTSIHASYNPTMSDRTTGVSKYGLSHSSISMHTKSTNSIITRLTETMSPAISFITSHLSNLSKPTSVQASTSIHTSYNPSMSDRTTGVSKYGLSHSSISMHTKSTNSIITRLTETMSPVISFITSHLSNLSKPTSVQASTSIHTSYNPSMSDRTTGVSKYGLSHSSISMHTKSTNSA